MAYTLEAACLCSTGKIRKNNEDNYFFGGQCLEENNNGLTHPITMTKPLCKKLCVAVFDGMGGENFGECASFAAANCLQSLPQKLSDYFLPGRKWLNTLCMKLNDAVVEKEHELCTDRMGTTMVAFCFSFCHAFVCNLGDSRAYRLRGRELLQLSVDHIEKREGQTSKKAPLTQHLGISPDEFLIEPHVAKCCLKPGDQYLLCSDGLTDMITDSEITNIMSNTETAEECVQKLIDSALEKGGRDNVTVINCRIR